MDIVTAITGASGALYAQRFIQGAVAAGVTVRVVVSPLGRRLLKDELGMEAIDLETLAGRLILTEEGLEASGLRLVTTDSRMEGTFRLDRSGEEPTVALNVRRGQVAAHELRAFLPVLPLADALDLEGNVTGPLDDLRIEALHLARGATTLDASGRLSGLPDSLAFEFTLPGATATAADLLAVLPSLRLPEEVARLGAVTFDGTLAGSVAGERLRVESDGAWTSAAGDAEGYAQVVAQSGRPLQLVVDADVRALNPAIVTADERLAGRLSGRVLFDQPVSPETPTLFEFALGPSDFAGRTADSLYVDGTRSGTQFVADLTLVQGASRVRGRLDADTDARSLLFEGELGAFDLQRLLPGVPATRVSGPIRADLRGTDLATLNADVEGDFSEVAVLMDGQMQPLPTGPVLLALRPPDAPGPRDELCIEADGLRNLRVSDAEPVVAVDDVHAALQQHHDHVLRRRQRQLHRVAVGVPA